MAPARRRRALGIAAAVLLAIAFAVVLVTRGDAAAVDTTASLVPPDALLYAHLSTKDSRPQDIRLRELAARFATTREQLPRLGMAFTPSAGSLNFDRDLRPWLGDDVAVAVLAGGPMLVAAVRDRKGAAALLNRLGATPSGAYKGVALKSVPPRSTAAFTEDHLVVGPAADVRGAIDRAAGTGAPSLADARVFRRATDERTSAGSLEVYAAAPGLRRMLDGESGLAAAARRVIAGPQLEGLIASVAAEDDGLRINARVVRAPGAKPAGAFVPALAARAPKDAAAFLELPGVDAAAGIVERLGGAAALENLRSALPQAAGLELDDLLEPLSRDAALTVTAGEYGPVFTMTARTSDDARTREALARLQGPLAGQLAGGSPFTQSTARGADAFTLPVTDALEPSYAVGKDVLVASTTSSGLDQLASAKAPITGASALRRVMPEDGAKVEALGFLDPRALLALGERAGLPAPSSPAVREDLRRIRAAGAVVVEDADKPTDTTAELFLESL